MTVIDLLEVHAHRPIIWKTKLDHLQLLAHFRAEDPSENTNHPQLRILFVEGLNFVDSRGLLPTESDLEVNTTAQWMQQRFGVSPLFFSSLETEIQVVKTGSGASLLRWEEGKRVSLDGIYRFSFGRVSPVAHVWFSHSLIEDKSSTYIIHDCPEKSKEIILSYSQAATTQTLLRPLAIDTILSEQCLHEWGQEIFVPRKDLIEYESSSISDFSPIQTEKAVEHLHSLSQSLHIIRENLTDLQERLEYLCGVHQRLLELLGNCHDPGDEEPLTDSFNYIKTSTNTLKRWAINYTERTGIRINLFFNVSAQSDNRTNLGIAKVTSNISVITQRDSSSMITMAFLSMVFLPGTFVSAIFSMGFFDSKSTESGRESLIVGKKWWLFPAISIPLTIVVLLVWFLWQRRAHSDNLGIDQITDTSSTLEKCSLTTQV